MGSRDLDSYLHKERVISMQGAVPFFPVRFLVLYYVIFQEATFYSNVLFLFLHGTQPRDKSPLVSVSSREREREILFYSEVALLLIDVCVLPSEQRDVSDPPRTLLLLLLRSFYIYIYVLIIFI